MKKTQIALNYAKGFEIFQGKDFWEIHVTQGYPGAEKNISLPGFGGKFPG
ncbi:hypothetical protein [Algoriphagus boritolerans]